MQTWQCFGAPGACRPRCVVVQALPRAACSSRAQRWLAGGGASISAAGCSKRRVPRTPGGLGGCWSHSHAGCTTALGSVSWHVPKGSPLPSPGPRLTCACSGGWGRSFLRRWEIVVRATQCPVQCCPAAPVPWAASQILGLCVYSPRIYVRCSSQPKTAAAKVLIFDDLDPHVTMRVWFLKRVLSIRMAGTKTGWKFSCIIGGFSVSSCNLKSN